MSRLERSLLLVFSLIFSIVLAADCLRWHPGFSYFDEGLSVAYIQLRFEGRSLPFELFKGCVHRGLVFLWLTLCGKNLEAWRLFNLGVLGSECALLYALGKRWISGRAGLWAACFNLCTALSFLRARSLLSYVLLPLELLLLLWIMPRARRRLDSILWGGAAALLLVDYEGWIFALPVLLLAWFVSPQGARPAWKPALSAFALLAGLMVLFSWPDLQSHVLLRQRSLAQGPAQFGSVLLQSLKGFFWGGDSFGYMGVAGHSVYPLWALPALALGLISAWTRQRWWLAWMLLGLLPMAVIGTAADPNRLMVAWPVLCLLSGLGLARLPEKFWPLAAAALLLGAGLEARAYAWSMQAQYPKYYSETVELMRLAWQSKRDFPKGLRLISELDYESSAPARFLWNAYGPPKKNEDQEQVLALVPWEYAVALGPVKVEQGPRQSYFLFKPNLAEAQRLEGVEAELLPLHQRLPYFDLRAKRQDLMDYLSLHPKLDPWLRSAVVESALGQSFMIGEVPPALLQIMLKEKLASASAYEWLAFKASAADPRFTRYLCERALHQDPRRVELKELLASLSRS
jgi:hypothetical protein